MGLLKQNAVHGFTRFEISNVRMQIVIFIFLFGVLFLLYYWIKRINLPVGELNPGLPRDRRGYSPLY